MTSIVFQNSQAVSAALKGFPAYANRLLLDVVDDGTDFGHTMMRSLVPRGRTGSLLSAVSKSGPSVVGSRTIRTTGVVFVDPIAAPHGDLVDRGTGVDGPYRQGVVLTRPSKTSPNRPGAMKFRGSDGKTLFRQSVKQSPSLKIQRGKGFRDETYRVMNIFTHERVETIAHSSIPNYFRAVGAR